MKLRGITFKVICRYVKSNLSWNFIPANQGRHVHTTSDLGVNAIILELGKNHNKCDQNIDPWLRKPPINKVLNISNSTSLSSKF
jgi:hypothetical protein